MVELLNVALASPTAIHVAATPHAPNAQVPIMSRPEIVHAPKHVLRMLQPSTAMMAPAYAPTVTLPAHYAQINQPPTAQNAKREPFSKQALVLLHARRQPSKMQVTPMILNVPYVMLPACGVARHLRNVQSVPLVVMSCIWIPQRIRVFRSVQRSTLRMLLLPQILYVLVPSSCLLLALTTEKSDFLKF